MWLHKRFLFYSAFCILHSAFLVSCNIINPAEPIPSYLKLDSITLYTNQSSQGSSSSKISDVWITVDGLVQGAYELPAKFPLLFDGPHRVQLKAGIILNGISSTRAPYAVLTILDTTLNLQNGKITSVNPILTYITATHFQQMEDFDHTGISFKRSSPSTSDTTLTPTSGSDAFEGKYGAIFLDNVRPEFKYESTDSFYLPQSNIPCYVELNYNCNNDFTVGVIANTLFGVVVSPVLSIRSSNNSWKKIYVNLTPIVSQAIGPEGWKIYLYAVKNSAQSTAYLYFDNIKVLY